MAGPAEGHRVTLNAYEQQTLEAIAREFSSSDPELHRRLATFGAVRCAEAGPEAVHHLLSSSVRAAGWPSGQPRPVRRGRWLLRFAFGAALLGALGLPVLALNTAHLDPCQAPDVSAQTCPDEPSADLTH
jgi:hypothetical protein